MFVFKEDSLESSNESIARAHIFICLITDGLEIVVTVVAIIYLVVTRMKNRS